jgi:hypothetical protein
MKKEQIELKIKPLPIPPDKKKISFRLPEPTLSEFEAYLAAYQDIYGVEPDRDFVADQIFTAFFESDRAFAAYQARGVVVAPKKADGAS